MVSLDLPSTFAMCRRDIGSKCCKEIEDTLGDWEGYYEPPKADVSSARTFPEKEAMMRSCGGIRRSSAACMLNMQHSIAICCRARFDAARIIHRIIAAKEISAMCWMEASTLSVHIDHHVSAVFISGFVSWNQSQSVSIQTLLLS